jgi:parallel beta-helix repeat protein
MSGNCVDDHLRHGVVIENTYGSVVSGNMIEECKGVGIVLDRDCYGITLSANVIAHEFTGGIELRDAHGCAVTGNSFPIVHKRALVIGPASDRIAVSGNAFGDTYIGDGKTRRPVDQDPAGGIVLEGTSDIAISGNTFSGLKTNALALEGSPSRRVLFSHNVLTQVKPGDEGLLESQVKDNVQ